MGIERKLTGIKIDRPFRRFSSWLAVSLCLMLAISLWTQAYSHGPGALIEGQRAVAEVTAHGHSHGPAGHNAADHDHQNAEIAEAYPAGHSEHYTAPTNAPAVGNLPEGVVSDGPRRPPRAVVI